jgi:FkbM family methyltransferase
MEAGRYGDPFCPSRGYVGRVQSPANDKHHHGQIAETNCVDKGSPFGGQMDSPLLPDVIPRKQPMTQSTANDELSRRLDHLLGQDALKLRERESRLFDELVDPGDPLVLFGAGGLGRKTLRGLRQIGRSILAFTDNNSRLHGAQVEGVPVFSAADAADRFGNVATFLTTVFMDSAPGAFQQRRNEFVALGCRNVQPFYPLYWKYPAQFLPHYAYDLPHKVVEASERIRAAWELLCDDVSRREYLSQIHWRLDPAYDDLPASAAHEIYFPPDILTLRPDEVFVDCGGYDGDTIRSFVRQTRGNFARAHVFEPDPRNFEKLQRTIAALPPETGRRIQAAQLAIGAASGLVYLDAQGAAASAVSAIGQYAVRCEPLDSVLADGAATFIKMDIEGAEIDALNGGSRQIQKHCPALAICAYHLQEHLWEIPLLVRSLCRDYRLFFRRYGPIAFDNVVLYAVSR